MDRWGLLVLVFLVSFSFQEPYLQPECSWKTVQGFFTPECYTFCPERTNWVKVAEKLLQERVYGQSEAVEQILSALYAHNQERALIFHFTGDNGTGKTLVANILAFSRFAKITEAEYPQGALYIRGNDYRYDSDGKIRKHEPAVYQAEIGRLRSRLHDQILSYLQQCSQPIIILDEYTIPNQRILAGLEDFFDDQPIQTKRGNFVASRNAIFILISDFGVESYVESTTHEERLQQVFQDIKDTWGESLFKQCQLQDNIVPFLPLPLPSPTDTDRLTVNSVVVPDAVRDMVTGLVRGIPTHKALQTNLENNRLTLSKFTCHEDCEEFVSRFIYHKLAISAGTYRKRNYRGVEQLVHNRIIQPLLTKLRRSFGASVSITLKASDSGLNPEFEIKAEKLTGEL